MPPAPDSPLREPLARSASFDFGEAGSLQLRVLPSWIEEVEPPSENLPPTIKFRETPAGPVRFLISVIPISASATPGPRELWSLLQGAFEQLRPQVVETSIRPHAIATTAGGGLFFSTTDRAPKPGEFLHMTSGMAVAGRLLLSFTILTNADEPVFFSQTLAAIRSAVHVPKGTKPADENPPAGAAGEATISFMGIDINSDAGLFVQEHPELLEDISLLVLQKVTSETDSPRLRNSASAALCALAPARATGINAAVWAPGEILAGPGEVAGALRDSLFLEGPGRSQILIERFETELRKAGDAALARPLAILRVALAQLLSEYENSSPDLAEGAIQHLEIARNALTDPSDGFLRAAIFLQLSSAYRNRATGERASNLETAIGYAQRALESLAASGFTTDWITARIRLANAYGDRIRGFRADNLEAAIQCLESTLPWCTDSKARNWAAIRNNLGNLYRTRVLGDKYANARKAIEYLEAALKERDATSGSWGELHLNLGNAYLALAPIDIEANDKAIGHFQQAAGAFPSGGVIWARIQHNLGIAYRNREIGAPADNIAAAKDYFKKALTVLTLRYPRDHRLTEAALGKLYLAEGRWQDAATSLEAAVAADELLVSQAITLAGGQAEYSAIGSAYADLSYCLLRLARFTDAFVCLEKGKARLLAQTIHRPSTPEVPSNEAESSTQLLELEINRLDILEANIDKLDVENLQLLKETRDKLPALIERVRQARSGQSPAPLVPPVEDLLAAIPAEGALAAPIITQAGTAVFVLKGGSCQVAAEDIVWIDGFTNEDLNRILTGTSASGQLDGWLTAYFQHKKESRNWSRVIANIGSGLWRDFFEPIHARLTALGLRREASLVLLPSPGLSILPLHAAWKETRSLTVAAPGEEPAPTPEPRPSGIGSEVEVLKTYAAEAYTITYCPSASLLASLKTSQRGRVALPASPVKSILIVADPTGDLPFAAIEGKAIAAGCDPQATELLTGKLASWSAVSRNFERRVYLHFACHGVYDLTYPERSFLALATPPDAYEGATGNLRLLELFGAWDTGAARLVVLSGCETAITDVMEAPAEYMGLATGWLRAGVLGVVGSLWVVDDLCAMLLMEQFYRFHRGAADAGTAPSGMPPESALRAAQLWIKDLTNAQVCERLAALDRLPDLSPDEHAWIALRRDEFSSEPAEDHPFSEPYWWAGFTYTGV